ncbi:MAG: L-seryl-tRNA(Sec) selenium transferase [Fimbriimonadaceae bacterium]
MSLRDLPKVDVLASAAELVSFTPEVRIASARHAIDLGRLRIGAGQPMGNLLESALNHANALSLPSMVPVINASGVILHTGLGRARLAASVAQELGQLAANHARVEFDLETGKRGDRQDHVRELLCYLTGAEDAYVVNNCAAAVFLSLSALAKRKEVILSRGEMVEIGGAFRMPDVVRQSGCKLVEIGCTNKTHVKDYSEAISSRTAAILRCHPSNFHIVGFTETPTTEELAGLAQQHGVVLIYDVGSGCLVDTSQFGLPREPVLGESLKQGADLVLSSGDKMLGGPQSGLILGSKSLMSRIKKHPLARAVRIDKLSLYALDATLKLYVNGRQNEIPTLRYLNRDLAEVKAFAERIAKACGGDVSEALTETGGGSIPGQGVKTWRVSLPQGKPERQMRSLRELSVPVIGRIEAGRVWLDPRTCDENEVRFIESSF